jgi:hypothetical protein
MSSLANVKIGVCEATYKGVALGHTKGGVKVSYKPSYEDIIVDMYGKSVADKVLSGEAWEIKIPMAETQIANILKTIPTSTDGGAYKKFGSQAGARLGLTAGELKLHPSGVTGTGEDWVFYKAVVASDIEYTYKVDEENVAEVTFIALIDETKSNGNLHGHIGTIS